MRPRMQLDWRTASTFLVADPLWRRKVWIGGLLLLFPFVGWPAALGYRKTLIERLWSGARPLLPEWRGRLCGYWWQGMLAVGVMTAYFAPLYAAFILKAFRHGLPDAPWAWILCGAGFFFFLSPFLGPALILMSSSWMGHDAFGRWEALALLALHAAAVFVLPAGFLQVSRTGRYRSALRVGDALRLIARHPRLYLEAWLYSGLTALLGHLCLPLTPWGVFWCYQSIVYSFNEIRLHTGDPEDRECARGPSWYRVFGALPDRLTPWADFTAEGRRRFEVVRPQLGGGAEPATLLRLGALRAPLPRLVEGWVSR